MDNEERMEVDEDPPPFAPEHPEEPDHGVERPETVFERRRSERIRLRAYLRGDGPPPRVTRVAMSEAVARHNSEAGFFEPITDYNPGMRRRLRTPEFLPDDDPPRDELINIDDLLVEEVIVPPRELTDEEDLPGGSDLEPRRKRVKEEDDISKQEPLDLFKYIPQQNIRRVLEKCSHPMRLQMNLTCRGIDHLFKIEKYWKTIHAAGVLYKDGRIEVMVSPQKETHRSLDEISADRYKVVAPYIALTGDLNEETIATITAALKRNHAEIGKIVINPISWGTGVSTFDLPPETITKLAESCNATKLHICTNTTTNVELLTSRRQAKVLKHLILGTSLSINQWQLEKNQFHTLVAKHRENLDPKCIVPLLKEWVEGKRIIKFYQLGLADPVIDPAEALKIIGADTKIPGDALWSRYYYKSAVNEILPIKWAQPDTANQAWIFCNEKATDPDQSVLLAFFLGQKMTICSIQGLKDNMKLLPPDILGVSRPRNYETEDFHADLTERNHAASRNSMLGLIRRHQFLGRDLDAPHRGRNMLPNQDEDAHLQFLFIMDPFRDLGPRNRPGRPSRQRNAPERQDEEVEGEEQAEVALEERPPHQNDVQDMDTDDSSSTVSMASPHYTPEEGSPADSPGPESDSSDEDSVDDESPTYSPQPQEQVPEDPAPEDPEQAEEQGADEVEMVVYHFN